MLTSIRAVYHDDGTLEFTEPPPAVQGATEVIVTFLNSPADRHDLRTYGISPVEAAELRLRFGAIAEDWDDPAMDIYDKYNEVWDVLERLAGTVDAPPDWSSEHDHYLYGTPKREP